MTYSISLDEVARSGPTAEGPWATTLEEEFASRFGSHAVATNSGTAALFAGLVAVGVDQASVVAVPAFGFTAAALAIRLVGAEITFVDVDQSGLIVPEQIPSDVDAVIAIDLDGLVADIAGVRRHLPGVPIIEDACPALGSVTAEGHQAGTLGDVGVFSGNETKKWSAGEGGVVLASTEEQAERARAAIRFGELSYKTRSPRQADLPGINGKMPELSAALGLNNLTGLDSRIERAHHNGLVVRDALTEVGLGVVPVSDHQTVSWHKVRAVSPDRRAATELLERIQVPFSATDIDVVSRHPLFTSATPPTVVGATSFLDTTIALGSRACPIWSPLAAKWATSLLSPAAHQA